METNSYRATYIYRRETDCVPTFSRILEWLVKLKVNMQRVLGGIQQFRECRRGVDSRLV